MRPLFFTFFTGFSVFWMLMASQAGGFFWTFGLLFFFVGSYNLVGIHFWKAYLRRHTHYTLTNKRAFIGTSVFGRRSLESFPISPDTPINLIDGALTTVNFASRTKRSKNGSYEVPVGFEYIENGRKVYALMRESQESAA